jgi:hypothetical protein
LKILQFTTKGKRQMENIASSTFSLIDTQASDELSAEELESVSGGLSWNDVKEGIRDGLQGFADGIGGRDDQESNLNYLGGHTLGSIANVAVSVVGGRSGGRAA